MENEGSDHYFGIPPLFVNRLSRENVERAVSALFSDPKWLDVYATLQE